MKNLFLFICVSLVSVQASASAAWSYWTKVAYVYPHSSGHLYFEIDDTRSNPGNCASNLYRVNSDNVSKNIIYSTLMAAMSANLNIRVYQTGCTGNYRLIEHVMAKPADR